MHRGSEDSGGSEDSDGSEDDEDSKRKLVRAVSIMTVVMAGRRMSAARAIRRVRVIRKWEG